MVGRIVFSKAGRDKNRLMVVVSADDKFLYLCDGKERPLETQKCEAHSVYKHNS